MEKSRAKPRRRKEEGVSMSVFILRQSLPSFSEGDNAISSFATSRLGVRFDFPWSSIV